MEQQQISLSPEEFDTLANLISKIQSDQELHIIATFVEGVQRLREPLGAIQHLMNLATGTPPDFIVGKIESFKSELEEQKKILIQHVRYSFFNPRQKGESREDYLKRASKELPQLTEELQQEILSAAKEEAEI